MQCPIDGATLQMTERSGIEIDYCPTCRGVWLDRGELDKLIEHSGAPARPSQSHYQQPRNDDHHDRPQQHQEHRYDDHHKNKRHKKENFLGDLFDF